MIAEILIGIGLGVLFPYFPNKIIERSLPEDTTGGLALLSSMFGFGMFFSPFFFYIASKLLTIASIRGEFALATALFILGAAVSLLNQMYKQRSPA